MPLSRKEYLEQCQICYKRAFDIEKGMICSITKAHAAFKEPKCQDFDLDQPALDNKENGDRRREDNQSGGIPASFKDFGIKNELFLGGLLTVIGFAWLIVGLFQNWIFAYPLAMIILGFALISVGLIGKIRKR